MNAEIYFRRKIRKMEYQRGDEAGRREDRESRILDFRFRLEWARHYPPLSNCLVECLRRLVLEVDYE